VDEPDLAFIALTRSDFPLVTSWLARPHIAEWWDEPQGLEAVEHEYGPCVDGTDPTRVFICTLGGTPVGFLQYYRLDDEPGYARAVGVENAAGIDLFLIDAKRRGTGLGPRLIAAVLARIWSDYPDVTCAMAGPSVRNVRSIRAFEKAGFVARGAVDVPGEADQELVLVSDRPTAL
jgi:RimJ/RimL family protein N-acetyltransferase